MADGPEASDLYGGFNDFNAALADDGLDNDEDVAKAISTSYGKRPIKTGAKRVATANRLATGRLVTAAAADVEGDVKRPMTSVGKAGFKSQGPSIAETAGVVSNDAVMTSDFTPKVEGKEDMMRKLERKTHQLFEESTVLARKRDYARAVDTATAAIQAERQLTRLREEDNPDNVNTDITYAVMLNLGSIYQQAGMHSKALKQFEDIVSNKQLGNSSRLRINIGNILFVQKKYLQAIKMYRRGLDQIPVSTNQRLRSKVMRNIGHAFCELRQFEEGAKAYQLVLSERPMRDFGGGVERKVPSRDFITAFNMLMCHYALGERDKMQSSFITLLQQELQVAQDDERYLNLHNDEDIQILLELTKDDPLAKEELREKQIAEKLVVTAAKLISPYVSETFDAGINWCIDCTRSSRHSNLVPDMEIIKAVTFLKMKELNKAVQTLKTFEKVESRMQSAAATNLSFLYFREMQHAQADKYADQAIAADKYNPSALVNKGNCLFVNDEVEKAIEFYTEALQIESGCVEALYNLGLAHKKLLSYDEALQCFLDLYSIIPTNAEVVYQLAHCYELLKDFQMACDWFRKLSHLIPNDPSVLVHLGTLFDLENDKSNAFSYHHEASRIFPSDLHTVEWLGAYYIDSQAPLKAIPYFEKAAEIQPSEIKWQRFVASCHRRGGSYQVALECYKRIHTKFPDDIECLKFIVRISSGLQLRDSDEWREKLEKAEKAKELREAQAESADRRGRRAGRTRSGRASSGASEASNGSGVNDAESRRRRRGGDSVGIDGLDNDSAPAPPQGLPLMTAGADSEYADPLGSLPERPKTSATRAPQTDEWDEHAFDDNMLPE